MKPDYYDMETVWVTSALSDDPYQINKTDFDAKVHTLVKESSDSGYSKSSLGRKNKTELLEIAESEGIEADESWTNADIIRAILDE